VHQPIVAAELETCYDRQAVLVRAEVKPAITGPRAVLQMVYILEDGQARTRSACAVNEGKHVQSLVPAGRGLCQPEVSRRAVGKPRLAPLSQSGEGGRQARRGLCPIVGAAHAGPDDADQLVAAVENVVLRDNARAGGVGAQKLNPAIAGHKGVVEGEERAVVLAA